MEFTPFVLIKRLHLLKLTHTVQMLKIKRYVILTVFIYRYCSGHFKIPVSHLLAIFFFFVLPFEV